MPQEIFFFQCGIVFFWNQLHTRAWVASHADVLWGIREECLTNHGRKACFSSLEAFTSKIQGKTVSTILVDHDFCQIAWLAWFNSDMRIKYDRTCQRSIKIISIEKTFAFHKSAQKKKFSLEFFLKESSWLALFNHFKITNFEKLWFFTLDDTLISPYRLSRRLD